MTQKCWIVVVLAIASAAQPAAGQAIPTITGSLHALVAELTSHDYFLHHPHSDPRPYIAPATAVSTLYQASRHISGGELQEAAKLAKQVDCEVVRFVDEQTKHDYVLLREDLSTLNEPRGWGAYLYNPESELPALVEAPHPLDDSNSATVAAMVFARGARGLLIAGAQRDKADVPDLVDSVFHQVHVAWTGAMGQIAVWQIHGFALEKHPFPSDAKAVLSTGGGDMIDEIVRLNNQFANRGIDSYAFNRLKPTNELNKQVNQGTPGMRFASLGATKNEQGRHLRSLGGTFVHVELERSVRRNAEARRIAAEAIADAIEESIRLRQAENKDPAHRISQGGKSPRRA